MDNILFIVKSHCTNRDVAEISYLPPLGVMTISTILCLNGYQTKIIDESVELLTTERLLNEIERLQPIFVAISAYTENSDELFKMCRFLKKYAPSVKIVVGGPHATLVTDNCKKPKCVDFVSVGEGEGALLELAEAIRSNQKVIKFADIEGVIYLENGKFHENDRRDTIRNLDLLPIVNRNLLPRSLESDYVTISSSRGCPGRCIYCAAPAMSGNKYRIRDIENVFLETIFALELVKYQKDVYYIDDTFTAIIDRVRTYLDLLENSKVRYRFRCESRVDVLSKNKDVVKRLAENGCERLQYGMESGNQDVLDRIHKHMNLGDAMDLIDYTVRQGILVATSFMFGHYCDTVDTMNDTVNLMIKLNQLYGNRVQIVYGYNTPFPGTYQYEHAEELGIRLTVSQYKDFNMIAPIVETDNFTTRTQFEMAEKVKSITY